MKIKLTTYVEVNPEKWAAEYDIPVKDVRKDVKEYFNDYPQQQIDYLGLNKIEGEIWLFHYW